MRACRECRRRGRSGCAHVCAVCGEEGVIRYVAYRGDRPVACHHRMERAEDGGPRTEADDHAETEVTGL